MYKTKIPPKKPHAYEALPITVRNRPRDQDQAGTSRPHPEENMPDSGNTGNLTSEESTGKKKHAIH